MKYLMKLTYVMMVALMLSFSVGCGEAEKSETETSQAQVDPNQGVNASANGSSNSFFTPRVNGMYDGAGVEVIQQQQYTPENVYPQNTHWQTRIEFLTQDGANVDPRSFNPPTGLAKIRITLINGQNPNQKYQTEGTVWVRYGSLSLIGTIRASDSSGQPMFDVTFGERDSDGPMLGLFKMNGMLHGSGAIILQDKAQKHIIRFHGLF